MRLPFGTPIIDGIGWIGAVLVDDGATVLALELGANPLARASWRTYQSSKLWLDGDIAFVVRGEMVDVAAVIARGLRQCEQVVDIRLGPVPRLPHAARPRPVMCGAIPR
jgi:hypothetical protein